MSNNKKELKIKKVKGRVRIIKAIPYGSQMVYIRRIGIDYFEYLVVFNRQIFSSYWIITPSKGKKDLTKHEVNEAGALALAGAIATIDLQLETKLSKKDEGMVKTFESGRQKVLN